eukprot:gene29475-38579_t
MKSAKRTDASAPTMSSNFAPGKGNAGIDGSTNLFGESNGGASNDGAHSFQSKIAMLERDIERRQESYISRERAYKMRIDELEEELNNQRQAKTGWMKTDPKISKLKAMQNQILHNVDLVQNRTAAIMQEQSQFTSQEEDRNFLIKQLVAVKKDNARLRAEYTEMEAENENCKKQLDINGRLRKLLAEERKSLLQVRQNYATELKVRTDMELLLRKCVEDFSASAGQAELSRLYSKQPNLIPVDEFTQEDRERALELLLSQESAAELQSFADMSFDHEADELLNRGGAVASPSSETGGGPGGGGPPITSGSSGAGSAKLPQLNPQATQGGASGGPPRKIISR